MSYVPSILYYVLPSKIINGTLFYAIEYFLICNEITPSQLVLKCNNETFKFILDVMHQKYDYNHELDKLIINCEYTGISKLTTHNTLILDERTYKKCRYFTKSKIFLYANKHDNNTANEFTYGFYDYQHYNIKNRLKIAFKYFKHYECNNNDVFYSSPGMMIEGGKKPNIFKNIVKDYGKWVYVQDSMIDTNNRFIPEARYFNKDLEIRYLEGKEHIGSLHDRNTVDLEELALTKDDIIIRDFLGENS